MKFKSPIAVREIAERFNLQVIGNGDLVATGINEIHKVEAGDITFSDVKNISKNPCNQPPRLLSSTKWLNAPREK